MIIPNKYRKNGNNKEMAITENSNNEKIAIARKSSNKEKIAITTLRVRV
jgi:hypothetical protein